MQMNKFDQNMLKDKERVLILIKKQKTFYTKLEECLKPPYASLIGIFGRAIPPLDPEVAKHFDAIFIYDDTKMDSTNFEAELPEDVQSIVEHICVGIEMQKVRLIETEDALLIGVAKLREKLGIQGPKPTEMHQFVNKELMKEKIVENNIATARHLVLDFTMPIECLKNSLCSFLADVNFPLFKKPVFGDGSRGSGRINDKQELFTWIDNQVLNGNKEKYMLEEFVNAHCEFWASVIVNADTSVTPHMLVKFGFDGEDVPIHTGKPIISICSKLEDSDEFPGIMQFVHQVILAMKLPKNHPNNFVVQGFSLCAGQSNYLFTECSYRQGGPSSAMSYRVTGISVESAIISNLLSIATDFHVIPNPMAVQCNAAQLRWPSKAGILISQKEPTNVTSELKITWKYKIGDKIAKAHYTTDYTALVTLYNSDAIALEKDVQKIAKEWAPEIAELSINC